MCPKKSGFSALLSHGKLKLIMEKSLNFIAKFLYEPCFRISRYFLFLKTSLSQVSMLNPQIFGTYQLSPALSISDAYRVLTSGFQLYQEP